MHTAPSRDRSRNGGHTAASGAESAPASIGPSHRSHWWPASPVRVLLFGLVALAGGIGLTGWMDQARFERYTGHLKAESVPVVAEHGGPVHQIIAREGETVKAGEVIARLGDEELQAKLDAQQRTLSRLEGELEQAEAQAEVELTWRMNELESEILQTRLKQADYLKEQFAEKIEGVAWDEFVREYDAVAAVSSSSSNGPIVRPLVREDRLLDETRIRAMLQQEEARNAAETFAARLDLCEARLKELERIKEQLPQKVRRASGVPQLQEQIAQARQELEQLKQQRDELTLKAPAYGTLGVLRKQAGDRLASGEPLVEILNQDRRYVAVPVPSQQLTRLETGTEVEIGFPGGKKRMGRVRKVPPQTSQDDAQITILIDPVDKLWPQIPVGSAVKVTVRE